MLSKYLKNLSTVMKLVWSYQNFSTEQRNLLSQSEDKICQIGILLGTFIYPLVGVFVRIFDPHHYYDGGRFYLSFACLALWKSKLLQIRHVFLITAMTILSHYTFLICKNDFNSPFSLGYVTAISAMISVFVTMQQLIVFFVFILINGYIVMRGVNYWIPSEAYFLNICFISTISSVMCIFRIYTVRTNIINITEVSAAKKVLASQTKLAILGQTIGGVLHEINNPLTAIMLSSKMVENNIKVQKYDKAIEHSHKISELTGRISKISKSVQKFLMSEENEIKELEIGPLIEETLTMSSKHLEANNIAIKFNHSESRLIVCNGVAISQAILNLINNSIFAISTLDEKWIHISLDEIDGQLRIVVTDSGPGIPLELQGSIFNEFFSTKGDTGTGLGLSICHKIFNKHGGSISLDTTNPHTSFVIKLPYRATV